MINLNNDKKLYFISDLHLMHSNIIKYCNRPFKDAHEMTETIIRNWNDTITDDDQIIFLGDFVIGCKNPKEVSEYVYECLNGIKYFIRGNHDTDEKISNKIPWLPNDCKVRWVYYKGYSIALKHYAYETSDFKPLSNCIHIHGHTHSTEMITDKNNKVINVSCEAIEYKPILFEDILNKLK